MRSGWVMVTIGLSLTACDPPKLSGADLVNRVASLTAAGNFQAAADVLNRAEDAPEVKYFDPTAPEFCMDAGIQARESSVAQDIAKAILEVRELKVDPFYRYVIAERKLTDFLTRQDGQVKTFCRFDAAETELSYERARTPIALAVKSELDALKSDAVAKAGATNINEAITTTTAKVAADEHQDQIRRCKDERARSPTPTDSPALTQAREMILANCRDAGM